MTYFYFLYFKVIAPWSSGLHCFQQEIYCHLYLCSSEINIFSSGSYLLCLSIVYFHPRIPLCLYSLGILDLRVYSFNSIWKVFAHYFFKYFFSVHPHLPHPSSGTPNTCVLECFKLSHSSFSALSPSQLYFRYYSFKILEV